MPQNTRIKNHIEWGKYYVVICHFLAIGIQIPIWVESCACTVYNFPLGLSRPVGFKWPRNGRGRHCYSILFPLNSMIWHLCSVQIYLLHCAHRSSASLQGILSVNWHCVLLWAVWVYNSNDSEMVD